MGYQIICTNPKCKQLTWANNIIDLIEKHTDERGRIKCTECGSANAHVFKESRLQEKGETWRRYIRGVITIKTEYKTYTPYIFLTSQTETGEIDGIHFNYYKDTRRKKGGRLKHGHGPGGAPVLTKDELFQLLKKLINYGCLTKKEIQDFLTGV